MSEVKNYNEVTEIAGKHLGKVGGLGYKDQYDPKLLVGIPRKLNREAYGIDDNDLPFFGYDVWNAYEVSVLTHRGLPVSGMMKIVCLANSITHVESKSIKLYLNSYNMTRMGETAAQAISIFEARVASDLTLLLGKPVEVKMFTDEASDSFCFTGFTKLQYLTDLDAIEFDNYYSDADSLKTSVTHEIGQEFKIQSDLLRSNCRVTNQPDWGDIFIHMVGKNEPNYTSLAEYIVSHRKVSHFHEEINEMVFTHLMQAYEPDELMVSCLYTRRGGLDINPIRATSQEMIPKAFFDPNIRLKKTLRQ